MRSQDRSLIGAKREREKKSSYACPNECLAKGHDKKVIVTSSSLARDSYHHDISLVIAAQISLSEPKEKMCNMRRETE